MTDLAVTVTDADGKTRRLEGVTPGFSLMDTTRQAGVAGVLGNCGGGAACGTCHVYVDKDWLEALPEPDEIEREMLKLIEDTRRPNSRLGCQIRMTEELDGLTVTVAPPSDY